MNLSAINAAVAGKTRTSGISPFAELELSRVYANPEQPRKNFDNIAELASSIQEQGLIQPIAVVKKGEGYMIVSGERRYRACATLGLKSIKAHILAADEKQINELALIENIQREDLSDFEKAMFIGELWASGKYAQKQDLANAISKTQSYISKAFSCLRLDEEILRDMEEGQHNIGLSVLEEIARVKDKGLQKELYKKYLSKEITRDEICAIKSVKPEIVKKTKNVETINVEEGFGGMLFNGLSAGRFMDRNFEYNKRYKITIEEL
ncbi:MAG: ParB/RepB/Spo0J family partition protein [Campylobacterales bacterium]|nr:ParB/RepB/Spo0J family partition protein [Campylobacterales bacterium]